MHQRRLQHQSIVQRTLRSLLLTAGATALLSCGGTEPSGVQISLAGLDTSALTVLHVSLHNLSRTCDQLRVRPNVPTAQGWDQRVALTAGAPANGSVSERSSMNTDPPVRSRISAGPSVRNSSDWSPPIALEACALLLETNEDFFFFARLDDDRALLLRSVFSDQLHFV